MTTNTNEPWRIEQDYINNISESATFVYIRGMRGVGKASLARRGLEIHQKPYIFISVNDEKFEEKLKNEAKCLENVYVDVADIMMDLVKNGYYLYLDEMQHAAIRFQEELQEVVDEIDFCKLENQAQGFGGIIISGSQPTEIDAMLYDPAKPLYMRGHHTIRIEPH